ncbi:hypothetical protein FQZ97_877630 [compost metagenome]
MGTSQLTKDRLGRARMRDAAHSEIRVIAHEGKCVRSQLRAPKCIHREGDSCALTTASPGSPHRTRSSTAAAPARCASRRVHHPGDGWHWAPSQSDQIPDNRQLAATAQVHVSQPDVHRNNGRPRVVVPLTTVQFRAQGEKPAARWINGQRALSRAARDARAMRMCG